MFYIKFAHMQKCKIIAYMQIVRYVQKMLHIYCSINVYIKFAYMQKCQIIAYMKIVGYVQEMLDVLIK